MRSFPFPSPFIYFFLTLNCASDSFFISHKHHKVNRIFYFPLCLSSVPGLISRCLRNSFTEHSAEDQKPNQAGLLAECRCAPLGGERYVETVGLGDKMIYHVSSLSRKERLPAGRGLPSEKVMEALPLLC